MVSRKKVGDYLFSERDPLSKNVTSRLYLANSKKMNSVVLIRALEKKKVKKYLEDKFIKEYKEL